jgi:hypothetical protein
MNKVIKILKLFIVFIILISSNGRAFSQELPMGKYNSKKFAFSEINGSGISILENYTGIPDSTGILGSYELSVGDFKKACYFSDRQPKNSWAAGGNQYAPNILFENFDKVIDQKFSFRGIFLVLEMKTGGYLVLLPVSGTETISWMEATDNQTLKLFFGTLGTKPVNGDVPLIAWSKSDDVYAACRRVWELAIGSKPVNGNTDWRYRKKYDDCFKYLGWCSWEEYKKDISSDLLVEVARKIESSIVPVRYMLVDDGHQNGSDQGNRLKSFEPDNKKFPQGWKPFLEMRKADKIKWMGIWHGFDGLPNTIHPNNDFGELNNHLMKVGPTELKVKNPPTKAPTADNQFVDVVSSTASGIVPRDNSTSSKAFYDALFGSVKKHGFDFAKIDYQLRDLWWYSGTGNAVSASATNLQSMEQAANHYLAGLINCMAHNPVCIFNTRYSAVTRSSMDYRVGDAPKSRHHLWQSFNNTAWLGQTVWGDHDMFHSSDPYSGRMMAVSKAMSGAPVSLSDNPDKFVNDYILPLCYNDGELLRPIAPGGPLPESLLLQPMEEKLPYRVIAPFQDGSAAIVVYNLYSNVKFDYWTKPTGEVEVPAIVKGYLLPEDYTYAADMVQPFAGKWLLPTNGLVAWDWYDRKGFNLDKKVEFELNGFSDKLFIVSPIKDNWAIIGRSDKYLSCAANKEVETSGSRLTVTLHESGPVVIWSGKGIPHSKQFPIVDLGNGFYEVKMVVGEKNRKLILER